MKSLIIGDLHLDNKNISGAAYTCFEEILKELESGKYDQLIFVGDIYHTKAVIRSEAQNFLIDWLTVLNQAVPSIYILVGNHDLHNVESKDHALTPLTLISGVRVVNAATWNHKTNQLFVPYVHSKEEFLDIVNDPEVKKAKWIYCHQGLQGFDLGNGFLDKDGVSAKDLPSNKKFIIGHYHKYQEVDNVMYVGTPFSHSFGEANQPKHFVRQIDNQFEFLSTKEKIPSHIKIEMDSITGEVNIPKKTKSADYIEVNIRCKKSELLEYSKEKIEKVLEVHGLPNIENLRIKYHVINIEREVRISENMGIESMLKEFCKKRNLKDSVYELGLEFLKNASV